MCKMHVNRHLEIGYVQRHMNLLSGISLAEGGSLQRLHWQKSLDISLRAPGHEQGGKRRS
jgi:hypothetical protein